MYVDMGKVKKSLSIVLQVFDDGGDLTHVMVRKFPSVARMLKGVVEEDLTGVHRLYQLSKASPGGGGLPFPAINSHDAVTKTMIDTYYGQKESVVDAIKRCTDTLIAGKTALVCGYGQVRLRF